MKTKILVAHASKYGSTAEIAEKLGQVLGQTGLQVDVLPVNRVKDLTQYKAVVLGIAVYIGLWRREATAFIKANEKLLSELPVWIFSIGPTGTGDPMELTEGWCFPESQRPVIERIKPRDITCFHGKVDRKKLNLFEKWIINNVKSPIGDFRDWEAITTWAEAIANILTGEKQG